MSKEDLQEVERESKEKGVEPKKTFAYKLLNTGKRVTSWFVGLSAIGLGAQIVFIAFQKQWELQVVEIPGLGTLFLVTGGVAGAVFGAEKIMDSVQKYKQ